MFYKILNYVKKGHTYFGVEITDAKVESRYNVIGLKRSKELLKIFYQKKEIDLNILKNEVGANQPVIIIINTSNVLTKKVRRISEDESVLINGAFPNLKIDDFYYQIYRQSDDALISICRKDIVNSILKQFYNKKIRVVRFNLSLVTVINFLEYFKEDNEIMASDYVISIDNKKVVSLKKSDKKTSTLYNLNGLEVTSNYILALTGVLSFVLDTSPFLYNYTDKQSNLNQDFINHRIYKLGKGFSLGFLFVLLLINFVFFNYYFKEVNSLRPLSQLAGGNYEKVNVLREKVMKSKKVILDIQNISNSKVSFYVNSILKKVPKTIHLKELNFQPLSKRIEPEKPIMYRIGELTLNGISTDNNLYFEWLSEIEFLEWVDKVDINYGLISGYESEFDLKININENI